MKLSKTDQSHKEWQDAIEALILAAEGRGPLMHARIGMLRALNRHVERVFNPDHKDHHWGLRALNRHHVREFNTDRKPHHWGKRKLKRDE